MGAGDKASVFQNRATASQHVAGGSLKGSPRLNERMWRQGADTETRPLRLSAILIIAFLDRYVF